MFELSKVAAFPPKLIEQIKVSKFILLFDGPFSLVSVSLSLKDRELVCVTRVGLSQYCKGKIV